MAYGGTVSPGKEKMTYDKEWEDGDDTALYEQGFSDGLAAATATLRSVFLECRQWRDKTAGETYTSAALHLNGRRVAIFGLQYGGLENMEDTAALYLERVELLPPNSRTHIARRFRELGIDYYTATEWRIRRETWLHGESLTAEELREELTAATFRRVLV